MQHPRTGILLTLTLLAGCLALFACTETDLQLQDHFFNADRQEWLVDKRAPLPRLLFYDGPKVLLVTGGSLLLIWLLLPARWQPGGLSPPWPGRRLWLVLLSLAVVPATIGAMKARSDIYCPSAIERYGGNKPYHHLLEPLPAGFPPNQGRCFPAGHASGGFALLSLFYLFNDKRSRWLGLTAGFVCGWAMGLYQMLKGAHFLSHTVATMLLAWLIVQILALLLVRHQPLHFTNGSSQRV
jgi:membrane-associated PAP2 superfamily phosphatase